MKDYSVPQNQRFWTSLHTPWAVWFLITFISGIIAEVWSFWITDYILFPRFSGIAGVSLFMLFYSVIITTIQYALWKWIDYPVVIIWRWMIAWIIPPFAFIILSSIGALSLIDNLIRVGLGMATGAWVGLFQLSFIAQTTPVSKKALWIAAHSILFAIGFIVYSKIIRGRDIGGSSKEVGDFFSMIFYIAHAIKWLIYALPTGFLFQWMLQRQLKR